MRITRTMAILCFVLVVSLPLLPLVTNTFEIFDKKYTVFATSPSILDEDSKDTDMKNTRTHLMFYEISTWVLLGFCLAAMVAILIHRMNWSQKAGHILAVSMSAMILPFISAVVFKILMIISVFRLDSGADETTFYGYNYIPVIMLIVVGIFIVRYSIVSIKGLAKQVKGEDFDVNDEDMQLEEEPEKEEERELQEEKNFLDFEPENSIIDSEEENDVGYTGYQDPSDFMHY
jgi:hypothetical protein